MTQQINTHPSNYIWDDNNNTNNNNNNTDNKIIIIINNNNNGSVTNFELVLFFVAGTIAIRPGRFLARMDPAKHLPQHVP
jgi:hypothetical protein